MKTGIEKRTSEKRDYAQILRKAGLKVTEARLAVLKFLEVAKFPLSPAKIAKGISRSDIDQATVYRTLNSLEKAGAVRQVNFEHGHAHFEMASRPDHHHVVCMSCGRVSDFTGCLTDKAIRDALKQAKDFSYIDHHSLELFGLCRSCKKKNEEVSVKQ